MNSEIPRLEPRRAPRTAVAALIGSLLIPAACGGATTETTVPPTSPTTITIPTTIPETSTTTEAPSTTTTITVPETTTTTIPITEPTGKIFKNDVEIANLGIIDDSKDTTSNLPNYTLSGRLLSVNKITIQDYQGLNQEVYLLSLVLGKYEDGTPFVKNVLIGREDERLMTIYKPSTNNFKSDQSITTVGLNSDWIQELIYRADNTAQIGIEIPIDPQSKLIKDCHSASTSDQVAQNNCWFIFEGEVIIPSNLEVYQALKNQNDLGVLKTHSLVDPSKFIWADQIDLFPGDDIIS